MPAKSTVAVNRHETIFRGQGCEAAVLERYGKAAQEVEACLCLPVDYDGRLLDVIPKEIIEKDYGCGNPSRYVRAGETALDLRFGSGKSVLYHGSGGRLRRQSHRRRFNTQQTGKVCGPDSSCCPSIGPAVDRSATGKIMPSSSYAVAFKPR